MIAPVGEAEFGEEAVVAVNRDSAARYPSFIAELELDAGRSAGYRQTGTLHVAVDADEQVALERQFRYRQELGLPVERLTSRQTRDLEPGLAPSIRGGMLVESDHQVDPRAMVADAAPGLQPARASRSIASGRRCSCKPAASPESTLDGGERIDAPQVVLAAGCWSGAVAGVPERRHPARTAREGPDPSPCAARPR